MVDPQAMPLSARSHRARTRVLLSGVLGSLMIFAGSIGVGWLASVSPLNRDPLFIALRTESTGVLGSVIILALGCWVLFRAWWRLGQELRGWPEGSLALVKRAVWLWSIPLLVCIPIMSRDVFAYIGQGRLVQAGQDPYVDGISSINNWFQLGTDTMWAQDGTPYGPLYLSIEYLVVQLVGQSTDAAILIFRAIAFIGVLLCLHFVPKLASLHQINGAKAAWIAVANPLVLLNFVASAHNDALMTGLSVWAVYLACQRRGVWAVIVLTASIGVKPITLVLLPFIGLLWAGPKATWPKRILYWFYCGAILLGLMTLVGWMNGYWFGWLKVMLFTGTGYSIFSPLGIVILLASGVFSAFGISTDWILPVVKLFGRLVGVALAMVVIFRGTYSHLVQRLAIAFAAIVVLSPVIQPWYLLWILPFFAATGVRDDWQLLWVHLTTIYFVAYQAADQLFIWQFLQDELGSLPQMLSWGVSALCIAYLLIIDPKTRKIAPELLTSTRWHYKRLR
ncbi:polyprenol phosphomannose-dependent alpha 1,6 mannosyltransferase MptB [Glutamicibacter sp. PS]|uniref:polyprenol phosphomannose-dependent alpha 1,6 mannosyltransferase MptB n=1 Tax=Glutamicibacter sp. PS TaxID=3075634 RepID=UPI002842EB3B|nr:polyprenol phosphomannose-dependent alpha 1,6 mannosyltransferase MptB [Glutamicibacter sp. PS]MDR4532870.1 polyprenol phosphomannose-dependent alpha 1,6 mannosyltransferase MptB [Glutamicibacter sp. PS]